MGLLDILNKEKRAAKKAEKERLAREFIGEYIIVLSRRVDVVDAEIPYYYYGKELFLCKTAGDPKNGVKQLTGEGFGRIFFDVAEVKEGDKTYYTAGEFFGEPDFDLFAGRMITVEEMESLARAYNSKARYHATHDYEDYRKPQNDVDAEFVTEDTDYVEEDVDTDEIADTTEVVEEPETEVITDSEILVEDEETIEVEYEQNCPC